MKQKNLRKQGLSLLLVFSMVMSLFTGQITGKNEAQASSEAQIQLNTLQKDSTGTFYTYPETTITYPDSSKKFHNMTVTVDYGHLCVTSTEIDGVTGMGIVAGNDMNVDYEALNTTDRYEAITFEWPEGTTKERIQSFLRTIRFTTSNRFQTVSIHATTKASKELKTTINGQEIALHYYNGHYYGYVPMTTKKWSDAYAESKTASFCGAQGYLATLTSRAEDRFILASFKDYGNYAKKGWIGCTRAKLADGSSYTDAETLWKPLDSFDFSTNQENFVWHWVAGPEAGERFGYQSHAFGDSTGGDGGFVTDTGRFSNWNNSGNIEPNGGASTEEAFGYYGKYEYGRWNDNADDSEDGVFGYYVEFGGFENDEQKFESELNQIIISTTQTTDEIITDGTYDDEPILTPIAGKPVIENQTTNAEGNPVIREGSILSAGIDEVTPVKSHSTLTYQWYIQNDDDTLTAIDGATDKNYTLTGDTVDQKLVVKAFGNGLYTGEVVSDPFDTTRTAPTPISGAPAINNQTTDSDGNSLVDVGSVLSADISGVTPAASHDTLTYQWYIQNDDDTLTPIDGATNKNYTLTADTLDKDLVVKVSGSGDYSGELSSDPFDTTQTVPAPTPIAGKPVIHNETTDDNDNAIVKEGTVLSADITGITPTDSHDTLTYQWYIQNEDDTLTAIDGAVYKNYTLTADTVDKKLIVKAIASGDYTGEVISDPFDTTRTNSGIEEGEDSGNTESDDKRIITIYPTMENTIYAIKDEYGNVYGAGDLAALPAVDENGNALTPNVTDPAYEGYYQVEPGGKIVFTVDKNKNYIIHEVKNTATNTEVISPTIPDSSIETGYDDNDTTDQTDDTMSIVVDPALTDYKYAILKKENGKYIEVAITKNADGNYIPDDSGTNAWTTGGEFTITFTDLPADGTYRIVAISSSESTDTTIKELLPDQVIGGSKDITSTPPQEEASPSPTPTPTATITPTPTATITPTPDASASPSPVPTGAPAVTPSMVPPQPIDNSFTAEELDKATSFIKEHATDPSGKVIVMITDLTRDIVTSGETQWNQFTDNEKAAVNTKLSQQGCPYTYEQLLSMAKKYKIPGFKLRKVMKKGTKSQLKLVKCKGATIVCTSTNKKVATVNKKGLIRAKKIGTATLTFTAIKGIHTNRLVIKIVVKKKFKNAKELKKFKSKAIKTPTVLVAKKRVLKQSTRIRIYDLKKSSKYQFTSLNKKVLKITKKGKYTGKKPGSSLVRVKINQNNKVYLLYVYVTIYKKGND